VTLFEQFHTSVERAFQKAFNSETTLSPEMMRLLASVIFGGYELFPGTGPRNLDEHPGHGTDHGTSMSIPDTRRITARELDLSDCYHPVGKREFDRSSIEGLRKSLNHAHTVNQALIRTIDRQEKRIGRYRVGYTTLIAIITGLAWEGVRALVPIALRILQ